MFVKDSLCIEPSTLFLKSEFWLNTIKVTE